MTDQMTHAEAISQIAELAEENARLHELLGQLDKWQQEGEVMIKQQGSGVMFSLGEWWADRPWRVK